MAASAQTPSPLQWFRIRLFGSTPEFAKERPLHPVNHLPLFRKVNSVSRTKFHLFLALFMVYGTMSRGQIQAERGTGLEGVITVSPIRPGPIKKGSEVPRAPLPSAVFSVTNEKGTVTSFTTDSDGRFRLSLSPGHYVVSLAENRFPRPCGPFEIDVQPGKMTNVEWHCDSGMR